MKNREISRIYKNYNLAEVALPVCIERSEDNQLIDVEGNLYIDFTSGYGVTNTGWHRKELTNLAKKQLDKLSYSPPWFPTTEAVELSSALNKITKNNFSKCVRATGGAEAIESIYKSSYAYNHRPSTLSLFRSYHGGSKFTINLSDNQNFRFPPVASKNNYYKIPPPYCYRCPLKKQRNTCNIDCTSFIEKSLKEHHDIGIFFIEPVIGSGGVIIIPEIYLQRAKEICKTYEVTLAFDEVITGFGRLGAFTAMELFGIIPDAVAFAKGMGGGIVPIGTALLNEKLSSSFSEHEDVSATFAWTPLACAVAKANIDILLKEKLSDRAKIKGEYLLNRLNYLFNKYIPEKVGEIRGKGMLIGIELVNNQNEKLNDIRLIQRLSLGLVRNGLMVCETWNFEVIFICPPLNISQEQIDLALNIIENELKKISEKNRLGLPVKN